MNFPQNSLLFSGHVLKGQESLFLGAKVVRETKRDMETKRDIVHWWETDWRGGVHRVRLSPSSVFHQRADLFLGDPPLDDAKQSPTFRGVKRLDDQFLDGFRLPCGEGVRPER